MHPSYSDITSRIPEAPSYWQNGGVPRYGVFSPDMLSVYWREAALMEIACQNCDARFNVAMQTDIHDRQGIAEQIRDGSLDYGDPPDTGCCASGPTMSSVPVRIVEYWRRNHEEFTANGIITDWRAYSQPRRNPMLEGEYRGWAADK